MSEETESIEIACPHCGQVLVADSSLAGAEVECPTCNNTFTAPTVGAWTDGEEKAGTECVPEHDSETTQESESAPDESEPADSVPRASFANRAKGVAERSMKRGVHFLSRFAGRFGGPSKRIGSSMKSIAATRIGKLAALGSIALILLVGLICGGSGVVLPLDEIAAGAAKYHHATANEPAPRVNGKTLEFPGRLNIGPFDIPLEKQSRRISFDFRSNGTTGVDRGYTSIDLFSCDASDALFITIKDDGVFVQDRRDRSDEAVKVANRSTKWMHVEAVMKPDKTTISVAGKKISFPTMNGIRWSKFLFTVLKPNLQIRNVKSFPSNNHVKTVKLFRDGMRLSADQNGDTSRKGVKKVLKAAKGGLAEAQFFYAGLNYLGIIDLKSEEVFKWWLKAAQQGHRTAQFKVGQRYFTGEGAPQNEKLAFEFLSRAANSRHPQAQMYCGFLLMNGKETPHDFTQARHYLLGALFDEDQFSTEDKGILYKLLADVYFFADDETQDIQKCKSFLRKAILCGNDSAREALEALEENDH